MRTAAQPALSRFFYKLTPSSICFVFLEVVVVCLELWVYQQNSLFMPPPPPQKKSAWRSWLSLGIVFLWRAGGRCELQPDSIRSGSDTGPIVRQAAAASTSLAFSKIVAKGLTLRLAVCCVMWSYSLWCLLWFVGRKADGAALEDDITHWV